MWRQRLKSLICKEFIGIKMLLLNEGNDRIRNSSNMKMKIGNKHLKTSQITGNKKQNKTIRLFMPFKIAQI